MNTWIEAAINGGGPRATQPQIPFLSKDDAAAGNDGWVYENTAAHAREGLSLANGYSLTVTFSIYEPGFVRVAKHLMNDYTPTIPGMSRFMLSDELLFGPKPPPAVV